MQGEGKVFRETSKLFSAGIALAIVPVLLLLAAFFINALLHHERTDSYTLAAFLLLPVAVLVLLLSHRLQLTIDAAGIHFMYAPYFLKSRSYAWSEIKEAGIVKYNPIADFKGWGFKSSKQYGRGYTTKGNKGLAVLLKNGDRLLVTVIDEQEAAAAVSFFSGYSLII